MSRYDTLEEIKKYNHNHDARGRFSSGNGGSSSGASHGGAQGIDPRGNVSYGGSSGGSSGSGATERRSAASKRIKTALGGKTPVDLSGVDPDIAEAMAGQIEELSKTYPELKDAVNGIYAEPSISERFRTKPGRMAEFNTRDGNIYLNNRFYENKDMFEKSYQGLVENKQMPEGTTYNSAIVHEIGHAMDLHVSKLTNHPSEISDDLLANEIARNGGSLTNEEVKDRLSGYAASEGAQEFFAESFSEFHTSKSPRPMSKRVMKDFEEVRKGAKRR